MSSVLRIVLDGITYSHPQPGGYHTYTTNLVNHLMKQRLPGDFMLLVDRPIPTEHLPPNWSVKVIDPRMRGIGVVVREQVKVPQYTRKYHANILHSPCATGPICYTSGHVVTIHDTIEFASSLPNPVAQPWFWAMRVYSRAVQRNLMRKAARIITVSHYSRKMLVERFSLPSEQVVVIYHGIGRIFQAESEELVRTSQLLPRQLAERDYVLALASASPRKNISRLLDSYAGLPDSLRAKHPLVLVCSHPLFERSLRTRASQLSILDNLVLVDQTTDEVLAALYRDAALFVFPSLEEGFGLPPLEAMACGTPVIASNSSSLPEVLGDGALLVSPTDTYAIRDAMALVLEDKSKASELKLRGLARSHEFSWDKAASETFSVYRGVAA